MSTAELKTLLAEQVRLTAEHLTRLAWIVRVLEERGEDLSGLRIGLLNYLRLIAHGQMLADVVVRFAATPMILQKVSSLPEPDQKRLAAGEPVRLVVPGAGGEGFTHRLMDPARLTRDQVHQVFGRAHIRPDAEQIAILEDRRVKPAPTAATPARGLARANRDRGGITVGRTFVPTADVVAALADLRSPESATGDAATSNVMVYLTEEEHRRLKVTAAQQDTTMTDLVRQSLRAAGLI